MDNLFNTASSCHYRGDDFLPPVQQLELDLGIKKNSCLDCAHACNGGGHDNPSCLATGEEVQTFVRDYEGGLRPSGTFLSNSSGYCRHWMQVEYYKQQIGEIGKELAVIEDKIKDTLLYKIMKWFWTV